MVGIAQELGRLEQKMAQIGGRPGGLDLAGLAELLRQVLGSNGEPFPAGSYSLAPVCERDEGGELLPPVLASWPGGRGDLLEINRKVDAIAELMQVSKNLRQPICRSAGSGPIDPAGQPVTVTFEEEFP
jgi:hypothetical protein